jgi:Rod binding domain-containing protein
MKLSAPSPLVGGPPSTLESAEAVGRRAVAGDDGAIRGVAEQFESLFLNLVLKAMRDTVHKNGLISGGHAEEIYGSMLDDEYAKSMSQQHQTGIADQIEEFIRRTSGLPDKPAAPVRAAANLEGRKAYLAAAGGGWTGAAKPATIADGIATPASPAPRADILDSVSAAVLAHVPRTSVPRR